jgi:integrase
MPNPKRRFVDAESGIQCAALSVPAHAEDRLIVQLLDGCRPRLFECLDLRLHCLNLDEATVTVLDGQAKKDRTVPLPRSVLPAILAQLESVQRLHELDSENGYDGAFMPGALTRKRRFASNEYIWQWLFPAPRLTLVPETGERRRYHLHETRVQKALRQAVRSAKIQKGVTAYTFRHSFASHLLRANDDIRTIQELVGHRDVRTTMIYTYTPSRAAPSRKRQVPSISHRSLSR